MRFLSSTLLAILFPLLVLAYSLLYIPLVAVQGIYHPNQLAVALVVVGSSLALLGFGLLGVARLSRVQTLPRIWNLADGLTSCAVLWASLRMYALPDSVSALALGKLSALIAALIADALIGYSLRIVATRKARNNPNGSGILGCTCCGCGDGCDSHCAALKSSCPVHGLDQGNVSPTAASIHRLRWHYVAASILATIAIGLNLLSKRFRIDPEASKLVAVYASAYLFKIILASIPKHFSTSEAQIEANARQLYRRRIAYMCWSQLLTTSLYALVCLLTENHTGLGSAFSAAAIASGITTTIVGACSALILIHPLAHSLCIPLNKLGSLIGAKVGALVITLMGVTSAVWTPKDWNLALAMVAIFLVLVGELNRTTKAK